jgi:hypothetical protein
VTRREYDFTNSATVATVSVVVLRSVDVSYGETAELCVRVHSKTNAVDGGTVRVVAKPISLTPEEPDVDFLGSEVANADIDSSVTAPFLMLDAFTAPFGNAVQLYVEGVKGNTDGVMKATISVDLVMRD